MAAVHPEVFYLAQRAELLAGYLRQRERELEESRGEIEGLRVQLEEATGDTGRLRAQLQQRDQRILELEARLNNDGEPPRKRALLYDAKKPLSQCKTSTQAERRRNLQSKFLDPCFSKLPKYIVKANVIFRTDDGADVELKWPQGLLDRKGQPPPVIPATGRGYRHQTEETKDRVQWCVHFKDQATARDGNGASRGVADIIKHHLKMPANQYLLAADEPVVKFRYGIDGRPQAKNNIIGAVMACITPIRSAEEAVKRPRTVKEEYCVFLYSGKEDYEEQVRVGSRVFREMEDIQEFGIQVEVEGVEKHVVIEWYVVSDWKSLSIMLGLVGPTGNYFCFQCYCTKAQITNFRQDRPRRSHEKTAQCLNHRGDTKGHQRLPVLKIPWASFLVDTLHTVLRIGGKLMTQFTGWVIDQDQADKMEKAMCELGITTFYLRKEASREGPSTYKWKNLTAKELKKVLKMLPNKMPNIIKNIGITSEVRIDGLHDRQLTLLLESRGVTKIPHTLPARKILLKNLTGSEMVTLPGREEDEDVEIKIEDLQELWRVSSNKKW
ncbi:Hypp9752 [Branchiostoma lanceolatum]|uniref:Hypp9752 protein n=1 Tax=Branchiostoma lanceolatum TaxID=7740 RepID=A0A8S4MPK4_BRALA|nr:Hypp9752 [Branchiostoma lanceolatum]